MKKNTIGLACVCMYLLAVSCQIPETITLKGRPGGRLSLGSPFVLMNESDRLENYINNEKIMEMMGSADSNIKIYEYVGNEVGAGAQAYVILYPITEMELDIKDYIDSITQDPATNFTYTIPSLVSNPPPGTFPQNGFDLIWNGLPQEVTPSSRPEPLFSIDLADMSKLVKEVKGTAFGLELDYEPSFANNLQIRIPALGINGYTKGTDETIGGKRKLRYVNNDPITPQQNLDKGQLKIYVRVLGPCSGTIAPDMVFDWTEATIDTAAQPIEDKFTFNNRDLGDILGGSIAFTNVKGYIYVGGTDVGGTGGNAFITLKEVGAPTNLASGHLTDKDHPSFSTPVGSIPQHSLSQQPFIDLTGVLNKSTASAVDLEYNVTISEMRIKKDELVQNEKKSIFADLVILLPMEFTVSAQPSASQYASTHAKLELKGLPEQLGNDNEDLFQRKGDDNDLFGMIESVKLILSETQNDILGGDISLLISAKDKDFARTLGITDRASIEFDQNSLSRPFIPRFEILIKKDSSGSAPFWLKRKTSETATFDFSLTIEARTDISQSLTDLLDF